MSEWKVRIDGQSDVEDTPRSDTVLLATVAADTPRPAPAPTVAPSSSSTGPPIKAPVAVLPTVLGRSPARRAVEDDQSEEPPEPDLKGGFAVDIF